MTLVRSVRIFRYRCRVCELTSCVVMPWAITGRRFSITWVPSDYLCFKCTWRMQENLRDKGLEV